MPKCRIDLEASPTFKKLIENHRRRYPKLKDDLKEAFQRIEEDYTSASNARAIPGFSSKVWKYRCKCSDLRRGARGGIRIIAVYNNDNETLYPIFFFLKTEQEDVDPKVIQRLVEELAMQLSLSPGPEGEDV